jgi:hypothetical protein
MTLPLPGSASCICTLLRPFDSASTGCKTGMGFKCLTECSGLCKVDYRASPLLLETHNPLTPGKGVHYTASWNIPQAWDIFCKFVQCPAVVLHCTPTLHSGSTRGPILLACAIRFNRSMIDKDRVLTWTSHSWIPLRSCIQRL